MAAAVPPSELETNAIKTPNHSPTGVSFVKANGVTSARVIPGGPRPSSAEIRPAGYRAGARAQRLAEPSQPRRSAGVSPAPSRGSGKAGGPRPRSHLRHFGKMAEQSHRTADCHNDLKITEIYRLTLEGMRAGRDARGPRPFGSLNSRFRRTTALAMLRTSAGIARPKRRKHSMSTPAITRRIIIAVLT